MFAGRKAVGKIEGEKLSRRSVSTSYQRIIMEHAYILI